MIPLAPLRIAFFAGAASARGETAEFRRTLLLGDADHSGRERRDLRKSHRVVTRESDADTLHQEVAEELPAAQAPAQGGMICRQPHGHSSHGSQRCESPGRHTVSLRVHGASRRASSHSFVAPPIPQPFTSRHSSTPTDAYRRLPAAAPLLAQATEIAQSRSLLRSRVWLIRVNARAKLKHRGADLIGHFLADLSNQNSIMIATRAFMYKVPRASNLLFFLNSSLCFQHSRQCLQTYRCRR